MNNSVQSNDINSRVRDALAYSRRHEWTAMSMIAGVFLLGLAIIFIGVWRRNVLVATIAAVLTAFVYWPVKQILQIRKENLALQTGPSIALKLPPKQAREIIRKLMEMLTGGEE